MTKDHRIPVTEHRNSIDHHPSTIHPHGAAAPVLVTGSHRSGSTWVGQVLATAPSLFYVHEPLNPRFAPHWLDLPDLPWFPRIDVGDERVFAPPFERLLSGRFPALDARFFRPDRRLRWRLLHAWTFRRAAARNDRFLLKDPFALFAVEWLEARFGVQTVLLLRHPCAFVASLKVKEWAFDFTHWTRQPRLLETLSADEQEGVRRAAAEPPGVIDQGCLLWNSLTRRTTALAAAGPRRVLARHEDLCRDPLDGFRRLFAHLDLSWTLTTERFLKSEANTGRNRESILHSWKERLSPAEIRRVLDATAELRERHYPDSP